MVNFLEDKNFIEMKPEDFSHEHDEKPIDTSLFIDLMERFYNLGWMRGTGGAMGCISGNQLMISPSALQKERLTEFDIFVYDLKTKTIAQHPRNNKIGVSSCSVLFSLIMKQTGSECVIHTHSKAANLITQLLKSNSFEMSHQEYIKGVYDPFTGRNLEFEDIITIPIIANKPKEHQLLPGLEEALKSNPRGSAILVRNHGLFVWGPTWEQTKIMVECIDYLLDLAIDMIRLNLPLVKDVSVDHTDTEKDYYHHIFY